ncbi:hypothetical protein YSA_05776 [Pseudomonas putida ND6]|uniref:Uncharacterized protein n=1 Tax=Pseudomonas putida ND6 TaxID=231023 RepID=I3UWN1_PSEPU|nr:hypothetical protein YSA_05776 [Pseudomonas putida ND6]
MASPDGLDRAVVRPSSFIPRRRASDEHAERIRKRLEAVGSVASFLASVVTGQAQVIHRLAHL